MQETATARHHTARMEESGTRVLTRTAQDTFEKKIPNKTVGSAVRLERSQRSNTQLCRRKSKLVKHVCSENVYTPNRWSFSFAGILKIMTGNNDNNVNVTGSKRDYRTSTMPKPKVNMSTKTARTTFVLSVNHSPPLNN